MNGAGMGLGAFLQTQSAAGEDPVAVDGADDIGEGAVERIRIEIKAAVRAFEGLHQSVPAQLLEDLGDEMLRRVDAGGDLLDAGFLTVAGFPGDEYQRTDGIFAGFGEHSMAL